MFKAIKRPKEYTAIKVPDDCEDVGKFVSEQFKENNIPLKVTVRYDPDAITMIVNDHRRVHAGDVIVDDYTLDYGHNVYAISQEEFDNTFKPADATLEASPVLTAYGLCDAKPIEGTSISEPKQPHVRIDIDNIHDTPRIYVDGELLHGITAVVFHFMTRDDVDLGQQSIEIEYYVKDSSLIGMHRETIGERRV